MATWGDFMNEIRVIRLKPSEMYVKVDDAITLWEERNQLRTEVARLKQEVEREREACAQEVEEFAQACLEESADAEFVATALRAVATLIRDRGEPEGALPGDSQQPAPSPEVAD
jgi:hypothetical protein